MLVESEARVVSLVENVSKELEKYSQCMDNRMEACLALTVTKAEAATIKIMSDFSAQLLKSLNESTEILISRIVSEKMTALSNDLKSILPPPPVPIPPNNPPLAAIINVPSADPGVSNLATANAPAAAASVASSPPPPPAASPERAKTRAAKQTTPEKLEKQSHDEQTPKKQPQRRGRPKKRKADDQLPDVEVDDSLFTFIGPEKPKPPNSKRRATAKSAAKTDSESDEESVEPKSSSFDELEFRPTAKPKKVVETAAKESTRAKKAQRGAASDILAQRRGTRHNPSGDLWTSK
jgi:hypothetical protein